MTNPHPASGDASGGLLAFLNEFDLVPRRIAELKTPEAGILNRFAGEKVRVMHTDDVNHILLEIADVRPWAPL